MKHNARRFQHGQAALIALLVLTIATTVGLSLIARTTTNVAVTRTMEDSARAFSAAEAGVEEALKAGVASSATVDQTSATTYTVSVASVSGQANTPFVYPRKTVNGDTETVWLVNHTADGTIDDTTKAYTAPTIDVCWSSETVTPAISVTVLYKAAADGSYRVVKAAYDPDATRAASDHFAIPATLTGGCGTGTNTTYKQTITFHAMNGVLDPAVDTLIALRIRPIYGDTQVAVTPAATLPVQGTHIESVGQTGNGVSRKIVVYQQYRAPSSIFDAAVVSEGSFTD